MLALPLLLAAAAPVPYAAVGTEPFWSLRIAAREMRLEQLGRPVIRVPTPRARPSFNGQRYVARRMTVDVTHARCSDGMSDRIYPDRVTVTWRGTILKGCGGAPVATVRLTDTSWTIASIDGRAVTARDATIGFAADRVSGHSGCNRFFGGYRIEGNRLTASALGATKMACAPAAMESERRLLAILARPVTVTVTVRDEAMVLANEVGRVALRRR